MKIILLGLLVCISLPSCDRGSSAPEGDGSGESAADGGMDEEKLAKAIVDELQKRGREKREEARVQTTREDLTTLITHLDQYRNIGGRYPTEPQGLEALVRKPQSLPRPRDWVQSLPEMPKDIWGNPYTYKFPGSKKPNEPELISNGPDGVSGNEDDLSSQD